MIEAQILIHEVPRHNSAHARRIQAYSIIKVINAEPYRSRIAAGITLEMPRQRRAEVARVHNGFSIPPSLSSTLNGTPRELVINFSAAPLTVGDPIQAARAYPLLSAFWSLNETTQETTLGSALSLVPWCGAFVSASRDLWGDPQDAIHMMANGIPLSEGHIISGSLDLSSSEMASLDDIISIQDAEEAAWRNMEDLGAFA